MLSENANHHRFLYRCVVAVPDRADELASPGRRPLVRIPVNGHGITPEGMLSTVVTIKVNGFT
jgi:hypothetical protein